MTFREPFDSKDNSVDNNSFDNRFVYKIRAEKRGSDVNIKVPKMGKQGIGFDTNAFDDDNDYSSDEDSDHNHCYEDSSDESEHFSEESTETSEEESHESDEEDSEDEEEDDDYEDYDEDEESDDETDYESDTLSTTDSEDNSFDESDDDFDKNDKKGLERSIFIHSFKLIQNNSLIDDLLYNYMRQPEGSEDWSEVLIGCNNYVEAIRTTGDLLLTNVTESRKQIKSILSKTRKVIQIRKAQQNYHRKEEGRGDFDHDKFKSHQFVIKTWKSFRDKLINIL